MSGDPPLPPLQRNAAAGALLLSRVVYAVNWYNIGAVLPLIGASFRVGTSTLGIVLGAFLLGVGLFQVPAGFAAIRFGSRKVSLVGLGGMGICCLLSGFAPSYLILAALRFGAGVGAAFFFSPGLSLIASYFPAGTRGPIIGLYNGGFSLGGAIGLFAGAIMGQILGWAGSLAIAGLALLLMTGVAALLLPRERHGVGPRTPRELWAAGRGVVRSRSIWALALSTTGFWGASYVVAQYFVKFAHDIHPEWGVSVAAAMAALVVVVSFPGGPAGGWIAERGGDRRVLMAVFGAIASSMILLLPFASQWEMWPILAILGFVDGVVFAVLYLIPTYLPETQGNGLALGVAVVNSIQVLLGSAIAVAFGMIAGTVGFTDAWLFTAVVSFGTLPLLAVVRPNRGKVAALAGGGAQIEGPAPAR